MISQDGWNRAHEPDFRPSRDPAKVTGRQMTRPLKLSLSLSTCLISRSRRLYQQESWGDVEILRFDIAEMD